MGSSDRHMAQSQRERSRILPPEKLLPQKPTWLPHIPAWKRMEHISFFKPGGAGRATLAVLLAKKSKALRAAFNISCCFFTQPCPQRFQDSIASRLADLGLRFPDHLGFPSAQTAEYLQTFYFTWTNQLLLRTLGGAKKINPGISGVLWADKPFSSCYILWCSLKR